MGSATVDTLTVLLGERSAERPFPATWPENVRVRVLDDCDLEEAATARKLFVFVSATQLGDFAACISEANKHNRLQALLVRSDVEPEWVPFMLKRAGLRTLRNMLVHQEGSLPARILRSWAHGREHDSIAAATVVGDQLIVVNCAFESFEIGFDAYPALRRIDPADRAHFEIEEDGVFLHWPDADVHLDIEDIRLSIDPRRRARAEARKLAHDKAFGAAVRAFRQSRDLVQSAIPGLSARHVRRIENGYVPGVEAIDALAAAHGLDPDEYLEVITEMMV